MALILFANVGTIIYYTKFILCFTPNLGALTYPDGRLSSLSLVIQITELDIIISNNFTVSISSDVGLLGLWMRDCGNPIPTTSMSYVML